jgi:hypothetical protein
LNLLPVPHLMKKLSAHLAPGPRETDERNLSPARIEFLDAKILPASPAPLRLAASEISRDLEHFPAR